MTSPVRMDVDALQALPVDERRRQRLDEIERVLKFDPRHPDKKQLVREYLALTEPEIAR